MKRRILFGWDFGAGNGHAVILREIARHFPPESHDLLFAMRYPVTAISVGIDPRLVIQAPDNALRPADQPLSKPVARSTYGEFVCEALIGPGRDFAQRLAGWDSIITAFKPDAIVAEYAPALSLFARGRVPVAAIGSGYSLPPAGMAEFPSLTKKPLPRFASEAELVERLNGYLRKAGALPIDRLPQLNAADTHGLMTLPLLDPYLEFRDGGCLGISHSGPAPVPVQAAAGFIAYFGEPWQLNGAFLDGLLGAGIAGQAFLGPPLRRTVKRMAGSSITINDRPFDIAREMPGRAVAIHMGTLGFAAAAACAGIPQFMLPQHQEN
ncbi:MAG: hypothetical protein H7X89_09240, partial [Rhizobiales bacterium]|nr:hypothetical protein [Hyphomicrobiales bacterium]